MMKQPNNVTDPRLDALVERCVEARRLYESSEIDYYEFLFEVMETEREVWSAYTTFATFIERCVGRPNPAKWTRYVEIRKLLGVEKIREIGIPCATEAQGIQDAEKRNTFIDESRTWSAQHNGVHASEQYAKQIRRDVDPRVRTPSLNRENEIATLRAENRELRAKLDARERENAKLRAQLAKLAPEKAQPRA